MLDLLGQAEKMGAIDFVRSEMSDSERARFSDGVRGVYLATQLLHKTIDDWVALSGQAPPPFMGMTKEDLATLENTKGQPLKWQRFSDGLVTYTSLADPLEYSPFQSLYFLIGGCAVAQLTMFANQTPIRGGIAFGAGCEFREGELYGPVLATAHRLERDIADYPRIVVDQRAVDYLEKIHNSAGGGKRGDLDRTLAGLCLEMIFTDGDGNSAIDFLGPGVLKQTGRPINSPLIAKAKEFVESQYDEHRKNRSTKLAFRYATLLHYFGWRLGESEQGK